MASQPSGRVPTGLQPHTADGECRGPEPAAQTQPHSHLPAGGAVLTLAEGEVEVAGGTAVTRGPLEACPAHALARVTVTGSVHHAGAGALAGCREEEVTEGPGSWALRGDAARARAGLTLAAWAVEARGAELTVGALEVGFAHAVSHLRVLPAGIALGPGSTTVTVWRGTGWDGGLRGPAAAPLKTSLLYRLFSLPFDTALMLSEKDFKKANTGKGMF